MPLIAQLARFVSRSVQHRGQEYFLSGRVQLLNSEGSEGQDVHAIVRGTAEYEVSIAREQDTLVAACSCPYFADRLLLCKHVWATVLAADQRGTWRSPNGAGLALEAIPPEDAGLETNYPDVEYTSAREWRPWQPSRSERPRRMDRWSVFADRIAIGQETADPALPHDGQILYIVDAEATHNASQLVIEIARRERKMNGEWGKPRPAKLSRAAVARLPDALDRRLIERLLGAEQHVSYIHYGSEMPTAAQVRLGPVLVDELVPAMAEAGRLWIARADPAGAPLLDPLAWDDRHWRFALDIARAPVRDEFLVDGRFSRDAAEIDARDPQVIATDTIVIAHGAIARADAPGAGPWLQELAREGILHVPAKKATSLLDAIVRTGVAVRERPDELKYVEQAVRPIPRLVVRAHDAPFVQPRMRGELTFLYGESVAADDARETLVIDHDRRTMTRRDRAVEAAHREQLVTAGFRPGAYTRARDRAFEISPARLAPALQHLMQHGWRVEAEGRVYRPANRVEMHVSSGIDWFELDGAATFDEVEVPLPELLRVVKRGQNFIELGDGSFGMLPEEWLRRYGSLAALADAEGEHLRFSRGQVALLDALLAEQPAVSWDEGFARARETFARFTGVAPADPPPTFAGTLRGYQRDGLGWLRFLRESGFGGCLADDMGLGKTVMVLALFDQVRADGQTLRRAAGALPSLVVMPRSLVFNWMQEARRFTPHLRVMDYTGAARAALDERFAEHDVVLTTYGTLRRDAARLKDVRFEYVVLDEAQAIKNASTASAKAVRLLNARHRLALSGTPIENHLGELWSLFEFLNPGLLGSAAVFRRIGPGAARSDPENLALIARGLKPFILRRTKEQVVTDLPPKVEQTIYCELDPPQRSVYDELRDHYRRVLTARITRVGLAKSKMHILEALLRLRQAACHPALIDKARASDPSAKLDVLLSRLEESREEDHKAIVFSQFTSFLALVRDRLDAAGVDYEYLDGQTRDRGARVERFQTDPACRLFLVSLKAGGLGLNLTAAEHVFLLDPWWNPAAEAQAIDRAHRIGQSQHVFAFRLIARDTVEERVLELQQTKRALADAILGEGGDLAGTLKKEDLELLLS